VCVERPGKTAFLKMAYRAPSARHEDWFKLAILDSALSGPSGVGGGSTGNKTSRLYKALVETELAAGIGGGLLMSIDPHLYNLVATVRDGRSIQEVEDALNQQLERVRAEGITPSELDRAKKQARALFAYGTERVTSQAFWLAFTENLESYTWFEHYVSRLEAVTLEDVYQAAQRYLRPQNRVVGWLVPTGEAA
jgi:zinc protease